MELMSPQVETQPSVNPTNLVIFNPTSLVILKFPAIVTKISISPTTDPMIATWKPSGHACEAQIRSPVPTYTCRSSK